VKIDPKPHERGVFPEYAHGLAAVELQREALIVKGYEPALETFLLIDSRVQLDLDDLIDASQKTRGPF